MSYSWPRALVQVDLPLGDHREPPCAPAASDDRPRDLFGDPIGPTVPPRARGGRPRQLAIALSEPGFKLK